MSSKWRGFLINRTMSIIDSPNRQLTVRFINSLGSMDDEKCERLFENTERLKNKYHKYIQTLIK